MTRKDPVYDAWNRLRGRWELVTGEAQRERAKMNARLAQAARSEKPAPRDAEFAECDRLDELAKSLAADMDVLSSRY